MCVNSAKVNSSVFSAKQNYEYFYTTAIIALCMRDQEHIFNIIIFTYNCTVPNKNLHTSWLLVGFYCKTTILLIVAKLRNPAEKKSVILGHNNKNNKNNKNIPGLIKQITYST